MTTQWRVGMAGVTGLDYSALTIVLRISRIPRSEWRDIFDCVRIMEDAALATVRVKK